MLLVGNMKEHWETKWYNVYGEYTKKEFYGIFVEIFQFLSFVYITEKNKRIL